MTAKYSGKCVRCRGPIAPGDAIEWERSHSWTRHQHCSPAAVAAAKAAREAEAAREAAAEAEAARWVPPATRQAVATAAIMAAEKTGRAAVDDPSACRVEAAEGASGTEGPWTVVVPARDGGASIRVRVNRKANGVGPRAELIYLRAGPGPGPECPPDEPGWLPGETPSRGSRKARLQRPAMAGGVPQGSQWTSTMLTSF